MKKTKTTESGIAKRTFRSALMEMLESEYKLIGSHKVIELIADDICELRDEFYPMQHETSFGNLTWITTSIVNEKPKLGQKIEDYKAQRIDLPLVTEDDLKSSEKSAQRDQAKMEVSHIDFSLILFGSLHRRSVLCSEIALAYEIVK